MGLQNLTPLSVDQLLRALAALGHPHIADPDQRPDGPTEQDRPELLVGLQRDWQHPTATATSIVPSWPPGCAAPPTTSR